MAFLASVGAGARTGHGLADFATALHAAARRGRGEALAAEPFDRALVLGGAFRRRAGVVCAAATAVFFVTLGIVSSTYRGISLALGLLGASEPRVQLLASAESVLSRLLRPAPRRREAQIIKRSPLSKPEVITKSLHYVALV